MTFDALLGHLRGWAGEAVVLTLEPEGTVLRGRLAELDGAGLDGALFALAEGDGAASGVPDCRMARVCSLTSRKSAKSSLRNRRLTVALETPVSRLMSAALNTARSPRCSRRKSEIRLSCGVSSP